MDLVSALLALAASTTPAPAAPAQGCAPAPACSGPTQVPARRLTQETVKASLNGLLRAEGLSQVASAGLVLRPIELDGDARTEEALVDVIAPEHCDPAGRCQTLVLRVLPCGRLVTVGHGRWLTPLASRTRGYVDLGEAQWSFPFPQPVVVRALHWTGSRYGG